MDKVITASAVNCVESSDGNTVFIIKQLLGHPMHCASNACNSLLRLLGAVHYPALRTLLQQLYCARKMEQCFN